jgi:protein farnesyltransferase/geranylgeranyltransferase type-1 subunit alpha
VAGYFRAILQKGELSMRALNLTVDILRFNPGDYHAWALRRQIIDHLKIPYKQELEFLNRINTYLEKNFQIWHHRRCIMEMH